MLEKHWEDNMRLEGKYKQVSKARESGTVRGSER